MRKKVKILSMNFLTLILSIFMCLPCLANTTCSRTAVINYQEVLVDAGSGKLGEGLRFYLDKDPESLSLLNEYQKRSKPTLWNTGTSTVGSLMVLAGVLQSGNKNGLGDKKVLIGGGALLITLSYLISKTMKKSNEKYLNLAIDQYNKRNSPRIYFSPFRDNNGESGVGFGLQKGF